MAVDDAGLGLVPISAPKCSVMPVRLEAAPPDIAPIRVYAAEFEPSAIDPKSSGFGIDSQAVQCPANRCGRLAASHASGIGDPSKCAAFIAGIGRVDVPDVAGSIDERAGDRRG